jgi:serine/threonine-protein kinase
MTMPLLHDGQHVRDTYEVERLLGEGSFGEVYRVRHRFLGRQAMKVFKSAGMTSNVTEELLGEALMLSRIGHPNIIRVFDANVVDTDRGACGFFTMEYVAGGSLEQFWRSHGAKFVPVATAVDILRQVCQGLAVAHGATPPIVHRDIKPQNILVGYDTGGLRARVSDFGLARHVNPLTLLASAKGTMPFKAPEVFRDLQSDSCAGDVWALGCTLYLLLTDRLPYRLPGNAEEARHRSFDRPLEPASRLNPDVDAVLDGILARTLAIDPRGRFADAQQLSEALASWQSATPAARPELPPTTDPLPSTRSMNFLKCGLGQQSPANEGEARKMASRAIELSHQASRLPEAADLLEEAFNKWPDLRGEYEYRLRLWRRGVAM